MTRQAPPDDHADVEAAYRQIVAGMRTAHDGTTAQGSQGEALRLLVLFEALMQTRQFAELSLYELATEQGRVAADDAWRDASTEGLRTPSAQPAIGWRPLPPDELVTVPVWVLDGALAVVLDAARSRRGFLERAEAHYRRYEAVEEVRAARAQVKHALAALLAASGRSRKADATRAKVRQANAELLSGTEFQAAARILRHVEAVGAATVRASWKKVKKEVGSHAALGHIRRFVEYEAERASLADARKAEQAALDRRRRLAAETVRRTGTAEHDQSKRLWREALAQGYGAQARRLAAEGALAARRALALQLPSRATTKRRTRAKG